METLFVVEQHKNQYYSRSKSQGHARFGSSPNRGFRDINCRTFESGRTGILPTPLKSHRSPKTPPNSDNKTVGKLKVTPKSTPIPISGKARRKESEDVPAGGGLLFSELWAGPTYSNSPPPSSLPIPKFSVRPKRTVSLNLPGSPPEIEMRPVAKSAPSSPSREHSDSPFTRDLFVNAYSATKTLCRILNLNINDD
ncbi:uncharacterized protein LOC109817743 [Cajanus cajan]|uniref:Uncharacterized protein n=1 Tax=Cajanus cajan TaxID=3821 RepID=A0A151RLI8_CAJCA|nr:uncharacterized protein LOC109817743 [Cajanus cajan]KYP43325.1 hypothetical protein KK1_035228 [Cajanus cajan]